MLPVNDDPKAYFGHLIGKLEARSRGAAATIPAGDSAADPLAEAVDFRVRDSSLQLFETLGRYLGSLPNYCQR